MITLLYILALLIVANLVVGFLGPHWYEKKWHTRIGSIEIAVGIEGPDARDLDFTFQCDPRSFLTHQISLWCLCYSVIWSRYDGEHADCSHENVTCFACGAKINSGDV
jgi:hypothetical protein